MVVFVGIVMFAGCSQGAEDDNGKAFPDAGSLATSVCGPDTVPVMMGDTALWLIGQDDLPAPARFETEGGRLGFGVAGVAHQSATVRLGLRAVDDAEPVTVATLRLDAPVDSEHPSVDEICEVVEVEGGAYELVSDTSNMFMWSVAVVRVPDPEPGEPVPVGRADA